MTDRKDPRIGYVTSNKSYQALAEANDGGATFAQIADFIEIHYEDL